MGLKAEGQLLALLGRVDPGPVIDVDWRTIESHLGTHLPDDYKDLMVRLPEVSIQSWIRMWQPGNTHVDLDSAAEFLSELTGQQHPVHWQPEIANSWVNVVASWINTMVGFAEGSTDFPFKFFPEPDGLMPWADINGEVLFCWQTQGSDPNSWPVILVDRDLQKWSEFNGGAVSCLIGILKGTAEIPILDYLAEELTRQPITATVMDGIQ